MANLKTLLSIEHKIIQAPMAGGAVTPTLVANVSNAGGLGSLASGYLKPEVMRDQIYQVKEITDQPFQVNVFVPEPICEPNKYDIQFWKNRLPYVDEANPFPDDQTLWQDFYEKIDIVQASNVPIVSFTFACPPDDVIHALKQEGITLMGTATTLEEALFLEEKGMDAIIIQGSEAGGHRGTFLQTKGDALQGLLSLIGEVKEQVHIPVIASGGIVDRQSVQAVLQLGVDAAQIGTRFLASEESAAPPVYKQALLEANGNDTAITKLFSGKRARGIVNQWMTTEEVYGQRTLPYPLQHVLTTPMRKEAAASGNKEQMALWAGQGVGRIRSILTVKEIMDQLCE
ncbi:NAD(P)H-dependent flavin oxidoreductase [Bacillus sp. NPDC077027]|uniref:NAD(P)H-dependent flavin oxidoreductase n=1 Tax=Bacillus sp. NPDC077027 TaxID=3390548 RepID=UPI003D01BEFA